MAASSRTRWLWTISPGLVLLGAWRLTFWGLVIGTMTISWSLRRGMSSTLILENIWETGKLLQDSNGSQFFSLFMNLVFCRDRVPFVFTVEMYHVINGGKSQQESYQTFIDYCCKAFNYIRRKHTVLSNILKIVRIQFIPSNLLDFRWPVLI